MKDHTHKLTIGYVVSREIQEISGYLDNHENVVIGI